MPNLLQVSVQHGLFQLFQEKMTANCSERERSPDAAQEGLPEPETAKRIVEQKLTPKRADVAATADKPNAEQTSTDPQTDNDNQTSSTALLQLF